jgi:serine/threonine protein kinase
MTLHRGERVMGRYEVGDVLAVGAMGTVWEAIDTTSRTAVVIKLPAHANDRTVVSRFCEEAEALRTIDHPNVVRLIDYTAQGSSGPCMVLERLSGESLRSFLDGQPGRRIPWRDALRLAIGVLSGLEAIHLAGTLHRDIKPANVVLHDGPSGTRAVIVDLGLARTGRKNRNHTAAGHAVGTPAYMACEQLAGEPVSPSTDLFQVGLMLYEAITGALPFPSTFAELGARRYVMPPSLESYGVLDVPDLDTLFRRALAPSVDARPPSAHAFAESLQSRLDGVTAPEWERSRAACFPLHDATSGLPDLSLPDEDED